MSSPAWLSGVLAGVLVLLTWFVPKIVAAGRTPAGKLQGRRRRALRDLIEARLAAVAASVNHAAAIAPPCCVYCGETENLIDVYLLPDSIHVNDRCATCDKIRSSSNRSVACSSCALRRGSTSFYGMFRSLSKEGRILSERILPQAEVGYLRTARECLGCAGALERAAPTGSLLDVDAGLRPHL